MNKQEAINFLIVYSHLDGDKRTEELANEEILFRQYLLHATDQDVSELMDEYEHILLNMKWSGDLDEALYEQMEAIIEKRLDLLDNEKKMHPPERVNFIRNKRKLIYLVYGAVAAVLILIAIGGFYFVVKNRNLPSYSVVKEISTDVAPGGNKAILTLDDGSTVMLDSAGNQVITRGSTNITQENGQLLYKAQQITTGIQYNKLSTPKGGQFRITLPDDTKVWLNSSSSLKYPIAFTGKDRVVELEGQGYFEVARNAAQPFKVMVNEMEVQVLGTHFDVMAYKDESTVNTTLLEGVVQVKDGAGLQLLKPGQQAVLNNSTNKVAVFPADIRKVVAWKSGFFEFQNTDLTAIMRQIERWYDVEIVYQVKDKSLSFGGRISKNLPLSNVLRLLEGDGVNFKIEGRKVIVLP